MKRRVKALVALGAFVLVLAAAAPAQATFHLIKIREVSAGTAANMHNDAYVELQSFFAGQNLLTGHTLTIFDGAGLATANCTFTSPMPNSQNQATALVGGTSAPVAPDLTCMSMNTLDPAGGAACWATELMPPVDCVSWGAFSSGSLTPQTGTPAPAIPDGMALRRSITPNCSTLLEDADDTNNSATDFQVATPNPRNNAAPITETPCGSGGGGGGGGNPEAPNTKIGKVKVTGTSAKVSFSGTSPIGSKLSFKCKLDSGKFKNCRSPKTYKKLKAGKHKVRVEAIDAAGTADPTPATKKFSV